jgi:voltage-gated potassium channel
MAAVLSLPRAEPERREANPWRRVRLGLIGMATVVAFGTVGYVVLGMSALDALYQTVTTISTVGFREVEPFDAPEKWFTMVVILLGVGTALYTFGVLVETLVEGRITDVFGRRRMERRIEELRDHVIVCGWGRVGRTVASFVRGGGDDVVVIENRPDRAGTCPYSVIAGDATDDSVLRRAGIERARVLVAAIDTDAENLYITLSGRSLNPELFIVARARVEASEPKFTRAGANRVVNPQQIGGARMAAFALQPNVAEFVDVVMHDGSLEFRLEEIAIPERSSLAGVSVRDAHIRDETGALVLALRHGDGHFTTNPSPDTVMEPGQVLIAIGTKVQLNSLAERARR